MSDITDDDLPQPSAAATQLALTATPEDFPTDSYSLALWLDKAFQAAQSETHPQTRTKPRIIDWRRLLPPYWTQLYATNWEWDDLLNQALDQYPPVIMSLCTCTIGPLSVWIGNWPYAYGCLYSPDIKQLPTVATRCRLRRLVLAQAYASTKTVLKRDINR